jgi:peptide/nickel transport system permease protein
MLSYLIRRVLLALFTCWAISVLAFVIIQLPPGDFLTAYVATLASSGSCC